MFYPSPLQNDKFSAIWIGWIIAVCHGVAAISEIIRNIGHSVGAISDRSDGGVAKLVKCLSRYDAGDDKGDNK
jgi:hypothetical protein